MEKWVNPGLRQEIDEMGQKAKQQHSETTLKTKPDSYVGASEGLRERTPPSELGLLERPNNNVVLDCNPQREISARQLIRI